MCKNDTAVKFRLSIIIPTRERASTLAYAVATTLSQESAAFEVIVSDNASGDDTKSVMSKIIDPRVRYINTGRRLSMCDNYEFALSHARGDYVVFIGDDDAVIPGAVDYLLSVMMPASAGVAYMWPLHTYDWPVDGRGGRVAFFAGVQDRKDINLTDIAKRAFENGGWKYYDLPSPYHAAIPRYLLETIRQRTGRVFHSTQPDVFTAMALPAVARGAINIGQAITFNGRSGDSNGLAFVHRGAIGNIDLFLREYGEYRFHRTLCKDVSGASIMIPDAILKAADFFPEIYRGSEFGYEASLAMSCRHGFVSPVEVFLRRAQLRKVHRLRLRVFLAYLTLHYAAKMRRAALSYLKPTRKFEAAAKNNIKDLADAIAADAPYVQERHGSAPCSTGLNDRAHP